jgi:predicted GNAT superfamily acetyltransferase
MMQRTSNSDDLLAEIDPHTLDPAILELNNAHAKELSTLDEPALLALVRKSFLALRVGRSNALLIALDETAEYDNPNFEWFSARFDRFVYVDRVVVEPTSRGRGLARQMYERLFAEARAAQHHRIVCEIIRANVRNASLIGAEQNHL